jgi:hypothetical protein
MISATPAALAAATAPVASPPRPRLATSDAPFDRGDHLRGHYWCAQGRTELTLVIEDIDGDDVTAIFEFDYPGGGTTTPASGSYRMRGAFDMRTRALRLDPNRWLEQPDGYVMVGLVGTVSKSGSITGTVKGPGCTTFYLDGKRQREGSAGY